MFYIINIIIQINEDYITIENVFAKCNKIEDAHNDKYIQQIMKKVVKKYRDSKVKLSKLLIIKDVPDMHYFKLKSELPTWKDLYSPELQKPYMQELKAFIDNERKTKNIIPKPELTLRAFADTPYYTTKVVILGQEPYIQDGFADGLAFSTKHLAKPIAIRNIFTEVYDDYFGDFHKALKQENVFQSNNLYYWAQQGVLLLNCVLTAEEGVVGAHAKKGWEKFVATMITHLNEYPYPIVFMLWGNYAQAFEKVINIDKHFVLKAGHPANADKGGWFGCKHFTQANNLILQHRPGDTMVNWGVFKQNY